MNAGGSHTGWSKAWEVNLWARMQQGDAALHALQSLLKRFATPGLLTLHPPLMVLHNIKGCHTCFRQDSCPPATHLKSGGDEGVTPGMKTVQVQVQYRYWYWY
jgi:hypothetical protein